MCTGHAQGGPSPQTKDPCKVDAKEFGTPRIIQSLQLNTNVGVNVSYDVPQLDFDILPNPCTAKVPGILR